MTNGEVFGGRYEIKEFIGEGGMATVYRAIDKRTGHSVAVKILKPEYNSDKEFLSRFQREAQAASRMNHHNIVNLLDVGIEGANRYLVLEYVKGATLKDLIRNKGRLEVAQAIQFTVRILSALQHAHERGIIHRDIKPQNILVDAYGYVKVADFGIARISNVGTLSSSDTVIGSVHYASPEQAQGNDVRATSDIYSTGVVLYEMLTGRVPFQGSTPVAVAMQHVSATPPPIASIARNVPPDLIAVVRKAMEKNPANRYQSARAMAEALVLVRDGKLKQPDGARQGEVAPSIDDATPAFDSDPASYTDRHHRRRQVHRVHRGGVKTPTPSAQTVAGRGAKQAARQASDAGAMRDSSGRYGAGMNSRAMRTAVTVLLSILVLGILVFGGISVYERVTSFTYPPDVEGMEEAAAVKAIERAGLNARSVAVTDKLIPKGIVVGQAPGIDSEMRKGEIVVINVSSGPRTLIVPKVTGMSQSAALTTLTNAGFAMTVVGKVVSTEPYETVLTQSPEAETPCEQGATVQVTVSGESTPMPSVLGKKPEEAIKALKEEGFIVIEELLDKEADKPEQEGLVVDQSPAGETQVLVGAQVRLYVGYYPLQKDITLKEPVGITGSYEISVKLVNNEAEGDAGETEIYRDTHEVDGKKPVVTLKSKDPGTYTFIVYYNDVPVEQKEVTFK